MRPDKVLSLLGIAAKAGKVASGEFSTEKAVKEGKAYLVIVASDASENTKKKYYDLVTFYGVPLYEVFSKEKMGESIGKVHRAAIAVTDTGFSQALHKLLSGE